MCTMIWIYSRFNVAIRHENYPGMSETGLPPMPGHTVIILPPVSVVNLLPVELQYYFLGTDIGGSVRPGREAQLPAVCIISSWFIK